MAGRPPTGAASTGGGTKPWPTTSTVTTPNGWPSAAPRSATTGWRSSPSSRAAHPRPRAGRWTAPPSANSSGSKSPDTEVAGHHASRSRIPRPRVDNGGGASLGPVQPQVADRRLGEVHSLPCSVAMPGGQLLNGRQPVGSEPDRVDGPPTWLQRPVEHGLGPVGAQVAVPLPVDAGCPGVQLQARTADQWQALVAVGRLRLGQLRRPVAGQRPGYPGRLGVRLQVGPGLAMEPAELTDPVGQRQQLRQLGA